MKKNEWGRHSVKKAAVSLLAIACGVAPAYGQGEATKYQLRIQGGRLLDAVRSVRAQTDAEFFYSYELVDEDGINPVEGQYTLDEALAKMFEGTGLSGSLTESGMIVITRENGANARSREEDMASGKLKRSLLAGVAAFVFGGGNAVLAQDREAEETEKDKGAPEEIVVTGTSIRGVYPDSAPLEIFTAEDIARSGATTLERFFETLPQNLNSITPQGSLFGPGDGLPGRSGIDLRGLGVGTTLVLLNGRRLTAQGGGSTDISLIPLGAIERVELLTDGASAVYGADAIGGVVNIILRDEVDGAETSLSYGTVTDGDHNRFTATQSIGASWGTGKALISYGFSDESALTADDRDFVEMFDTTTLTPDAQRHTLLVTAEQEITNDLSLYGDILYSLREAQFGSGTVVPSRSVIAFGERDLDQEQVFLSGGFNYAITDDLQLNVHSSYLNSHSNFRSRIFNQDLSTSLITSDNSSEREKDAEVIDFLAKIDGKLFDLPAGEVKFSVGGGIFDQEFTTPPFLPIRGTDFTTLERSSRSFFAETFVPLVSETQNMPGIRRLEISAAARYTEYDDFGSDVSPRFGLLWSPFDGLNLRGTYAESFRAPTLLELDSRNGTADILPLGLFSAFFPDIFSDDGSTVLLNLTGPAGQELTPEFSESFTLGFDFNPKALPGLDISMTYFNIDYTDRIGTPDRNGAALFRPAEFLELYNDSPTRAELAAIIAAYAGVDDRFGAVVGDPNDIDALSDAVTVILDNRTGNLAISRTDGVDLSFSYARETRMGNINFGGSASYTFDSVQALTETSPEITLLDTVGNPTSLKFSANAGYSRGGFSSQVNVNYVDSYANVNVTPEEPVDSWTTIDLSLRYTFGDTGSILSDAALSLTVNNLFDQDPPFVEQRDFGGLTGRGLTSAIGYDPTNANPVGRFIAVGLTKQF